MTLDIINDLDDVPSLVKALEDLARDAALDCEDHRLHPSEVRLETPVHVALIREKLTDGSVVYNLRIIERK